MVLLHVQLQAGCCGEGSGKAQGHVRGNPDPFIDYGGKKLSGHQQLSRQNFDGESQRLHVAFFFILVGAIRLECHSDVYRLLRLLFLPRQ